jgi:T-complex protein 1 subunit zeta
MSIQLINNNSDVAHQNQALLINISAAASLQNILKSNLGPRGTLKMLVSGAGDIRITKDGNVLLNDMQIQHPTAALIARTATAQDDETGDGTTTTVLLIGEMLQQAQRYLNEGVHPTVLIEGIHLARNEAQHFLEKYQQEMKKIKVDREVLLNVAKTTLKTKLHEKLAEKMSDIIVDSVQTIQMPNEPIDLFMVQIMHMKHRSDDETRFVNGLVLDHGARHPDMPKSIKNCYIMTLNVSLEYEKSEVNATFFVDSAEKRQRMATAERKVVDEKVAKIIEFKKSVCDNSNDKEPKNFVVINQKGIDPGALDMLAKAGILALRRAKRRNMERLTKACGGVALNALEDLTPECLGWAEHVYEQVLGEEKYTFVEGCKHPHSCTILIKGPNNYTIARIKDAVRDALRAVKNTIEDDCVIPGAGAFEIALHNHIMEYAKTVPGRPQLGVKCFAESLLVIPKTLAQNSGFDSQDVLITLQQAASKGQVAGLDIYTGQVLDPIQAGILDCVTVKKHTMEAATYTATQLLYVDEILKAGKIQKK